MTRNETEWIDYCKGEDSNYTIIVDNDCAYVVDLTKDGCVFEFENYGWQLALDLFRYIGCNAEEA